MLHIDYIVICPHFVFHLSWEGSRIHAGTPKRELGPFQIIKKDVTHELL